MRALPISEVDQKFKKVRNKEKCIPVTDMRIYNSKEINLQIKDKSVGTFKGQNPAVGVHQSGVCSDGPPQRLHRHTHIDNHNTVRR